MLDSIVLFCIPFAGGNAYSYRPLEVKIGPSIKMVPLELPGRGRRSGEPRLTSMRSIAHDLMTAMRPFMGERYALFGHSMGALAAYLLASQLAKMQLPQPLHLFVSGKGPPHRVTSERQWHTLPLDQFKLKLAELGGSPKAVLDDKELLNYFAPIIRDDMRAVAEYQHETVTPLSIPVTAMIGDSETTTREEALAWSEITTGECRVLQYEGGHFFLFDHVEDICKLIQSTLIH